MRSIFSGGAAPFPLGEAGVAAARVDVVAVARQAVDQFPQFVQSFARDRRNWQHGIFKHGFKFSQRADPLTTRELVDLRSDDRRPVGRALEPLPGGPIAFQARMPDVDQEQRATRRRADGRRAGWEYLCPACPPVLPILPKVRARQLFELPRCRRPAACVPIPRQIDQVERRGRSPRDPVHIRQPRLARRRARSRDTLPKQRIDQARFADIRTSHHGHFWQTISGKAGRAGGARDEFGGDFQRAGGAGRAGRAGKVNMP